MRLGDSTHRSESGTRSSQYRVQHGLFRRAQNRQANTDMSQKVLTGFACNPNVYGVVIMRSACYATGLGCETVGHKLLREKIQAMT